ncbi:hypothetical protein OHT61_03900 [Streptomyces sp. NBC_00178]|uniref:hypothetical protein n=1 Tax=Streptomyces sp. NBC_00178 TaxID=2975672 RepID=UPI002E2AC2E7|nr:hypothetical protein [Streptomyces sp. NBC_00178]
MNPGRGHRAVRAALFAAVCVLLAATGHAFMAGAAVPWWAMALALLGTAAAAWLLASRERGLFAVTSAAVVVQTVLHTGFALARSVPRAPRPAPVSFAHRWAEQLLCGEGAARLSDQEAAEVVRDAGLGNLISQPPPGQVPHPAHHMVSGMPDAPASWIHGSHATEGMPSTGMLVAHLLAAVLCGLWLAHGERALFRVVRAFAGRIGSPLRMLLCLCAPPRRPRTRMRRPRTVRAPGLLPLVHSITSRGPPTGTAAV